MCDTCSICLSEIPSFQTRQKNYTRTLSCGHSFHTSCIQSWLNSHKSCPYCREDVYTYIIQWITNISHTNPIYTCNASLFRNISLTFKDIEFNNLYYQLIEQSPQAWVIINDLQFPLYRIKAVKDNVEHTHFISYYLRQVLLFGSNDNISQRLINNKANDGNLTFLDTDINLDRYLSRHNYDVLYSWAFDMFIGYKEIYNINYKTFYNTLFTDIFTMTISTYHSCITIDDYQTVVCSVIKALYELFNINIDTSYLFKMSEDSISLEKMSVISLFVNMNIIQNFFELKNTETRLILFGR